METTYYSLASKSSFNKALRHFFAVNDAVGEIESKSNLADYINDLLDDEEIHPDQVLPIIGAVVRDKFEYTYYSYSVTKTVTEFQKIQDELIRWNALDIIIIYFGPDGKRFVINPKSADSWERCREIHKDQLIVIYTKFLKEKNVKLEEEAIKTFIDIFSDKDVFINKSFIDQTIVNRPAAASQQTAKTASGAPSAASAPARAKKVSITPKYGVVVSNELFHNGNVEAWKKILESFEVKYPDLKVHVMFGGEVINDINSLFKWGKVKHNDSIYFQVSGENIMGVSKLQKYLYEGASQRYEQFLKLGVGRVLNIF
jgi:ribosomal protein L12E/L44/L45/RPP1/RPP2